MVETTKNYKKTVKKQVMLEGTLLKAEWDFEDGYSKIKLSNTKYHQQDDGPLLEEAYIEPKYLSDVIDILVAYRDAMEDVCFLNKPQPAYRHLVTTLEGPQDTGSQVQGGPA